MLKEKELPVSEGTERLKRINHTALNSQGTYDWYDENLIMLYFSEKVNGREIEEFFIETDSDEEVEMKLENIRATENLFKMMKEDA